MSAARELRAAGLDAASGERDRAGRWPNPEIAWNQEKLDGPGDENSPIQPHDYYQQSKYEAEPVVLDYIDNFMDAFVLAMKPGKGVGHAYLIADEEYVTIEALVRRAARAMDASVRFVRLPVWPVVAAGHVVEAACKPFGLTPPLHPRRVDWHRQNRAFRIDKAKRELGYRPQIGLDEGLRRGAQWYRSEGLLNA